MGSRDQDEVNFLKNLTPNISKVNAYDLFSTSPEIGVLDAHQISTLQPQKFDLICFIVAII